MSPIAFFAFLNCLKVEKFRFEFWILSLVGRLSILGQRESCFGRGHISPRQGLPRIRLFVYTVETQIAKKNFTEIEMLQRLYIGMAFGFDTFINV